MAELANEEEEADDYDNESSACLDEYGWDPSVDMYLEEVVEEAPLLPNGVIDFSWVCSMFLETLSPDEDQVEAALERFSPSALQERYAYLRSRRVPSSHTAEKPDKEQSVAEESHQVLSVSRSSDIGGYASSDDVARKPDIAPESSSTHRPGRDRVLDAMQNFLYGRPRPEAQETPEKPPLACSSANVPETSVCLDSNNEIAEIEPAKVIGDASAPSVTEELSVPACTNEAMLLEELRWHGEALRRCADGAEASSLAVEAAERRKALLWRLGLGPKEVVAGRGSADYTGETL